VDNNSSIKLITCLKGGEKCWEDYLSCSNKNGQLAYAFEKRMETVGNKYQEVLDSLITQGPRETTKQLNEVFNPMIDHFKKRSKKFKEHENEFKIITRKLEEQRHDSDKQED
jgi:hypothetical protein